MKRPHPHTIAHTDHVFESSECGTQGFTGERVPYGFHFSRVPFPLALATVDHSHFRE